jgi:hypothetical protein
MTSRHIEDEDEDEDNLYLDSKHILPLLRTQEDIGKLE